jgi:hypothetical protein
MFTRLIAFGTRPEMVEDFTLRMPLGWRTENRLLFILAKRLNRKSQAGRH